MLRSPHKSSNSNFYLPWTITQRQTFVCTRLFLMSETKGNYQGAANWQAVLHQHFVQVALYRVSPVLWHTVAPLKRMWFAKQPFKNPLKVLTLTGIYRTDSSGFIFQLVEDIWYGRHVLWNASWGSLALGFYWHYAITTAVICTMVTQDCITCENLDVLRVKFEVLLTVSL